jgi:hypothetical protein
LVLILTVIRKKSHHRSGLHLLLLVHLHHLLHHWHHGLWILHIRLSIGHGVSKHHLQIQILVVGELDVSAPHHVHHVGWVHVHLHLRRSLSKIVLWLLSHYLGAFPNLDITMSIKTLVSVLAEALLLDVLALDSLVAVVNKVLWAWLLS